MMLVIWISRWMQSKFETNSQSWSISEQGHHSAGTNRTKNLWELQKSISLLLPFQLKYQICKHFSH